MKSFGGGGGVNVINPIVRTERFGTSLSEKFYTGLFIENFTASSGNVSIPSDSR